MSYWIATSSIRVELSVTDEFIRTNGVNRAEKDGEEQRCVFSANIINGIPDLVADVIEVLNDGDDVRT